MEREKLKRCTKNYNSQNKLASSGYLCILCGSFRFSFALSLFKQKMDIFVKYVHFTLGIHILLEKNHWVHKFSSGFYHKTLPNCMYLQSLSTVHDWTAYWFINMYCFSRKTDLTHSPRLLSWKSSLQRNPSPLPYAWYFSSAWKACPHFSSSVCASFYLFYSGNLHGLLNEGLPSEL